MTSIDDIDHKLQVGDRVVTGYKHHPGVWVVTSIDAGDGIVGCGNGTVKTAFFISALRPTVAQCLVNARRRRRIA